MERTCETLVSSVSGISMETFIMKRTRETLVSSLSGISLAEDDVMDDESPLNGNIQCYEAYM